MPLFIRATCRRSSTSAVRRSAQPHDRSLDLDEDRLPVADGSGTVDLGLDRVEIVTPDLSIPGDPNGTIYEPRPEGRLLTPKTLELERDFRTIRLILAQRYATANKLNHATADPNDVDRACRHRLHVPRASRGPSPTGAADNSRHRGRRHPAAPHADAVVDRPEQHPQLRSRARRDHRRGREEPDTRVAREGRPLRRPLTSPVSSANATRMAVR